MTDTAQPSNVEPRWDELSATHFQRLYELAQQMSADLAGLDGFGALSLDEFMDMATVEATRRSGVWPQPLTDKD